MTTRTFFLGMLAVLVAGAAAWYFVRPDLDRVGDSTPVRVDDEAVRDTYSPGSTNVMTPVEPITGDILEPGDEAPNFTLETLDGGTFELADHAGRVVVLNFWATWCEPCRDEMPDLVMLQDSLGDDGLLVAGVSLDEEGRDIVEEFHETFPVDYPLLLNGQSVARDYGAHYVVPTTYVVDRMGQIAERFEGAMTLEELLPSMERHLQPVE